MELSGLPQVRAMEFAINTIHGMEPVFKQPYWMDLAKVKKQVDEPLRLGVIKPSVFPEGVSP